MPDTEFWSERIPREDPRLDWSPQHDPKSLNFPVTAALPAAIEIVPRSWRLGAILDQGEEGACFPENTFVRMADGSQRRISEIRLLESVVSAEGRTGLVTHLLARRAVRGLVEINCEGQIPLRCTPEHPILTLRGYVPAEELRPDDKLAVTRYLPLNDDLIDVNSLVSVSDLRGVISGVVNIGSVLSEIAPLPQLLARTPALGRLIGLYAAEGHTTPNKVTWSFGAHEIDTLAAEVISLCKTVFDAQARIQRRPNGAINVVLYGKTWRRLFEVLVPGTTRHGDKRLSGHVTGGSREYLRALLEGWCDGDGYQRHRSARNTEVTGPTVSRNLALDLHAIATGLGMRPRVRMNKPTMNSHARTRQMRYDVSWQLGAGSPRSALTTDSAHWRRVRSVTAVPYESYVYNIEVEGDHSYVADGIGVHNCVGFGHTADLLAAPQPNYTVDSAGGSRYAQNVYQRAKQIDDWPGEAYDGTSVLAGDKVLVERGFIASYRWAFSVEDIRDAIISIGPVVIGIPWYAAMYETKRNGVVEVAGRLVGGHCLTIYGYHPSMRIYGEPLNPATGARYYEVFKWRNSWGNSYGRNGNGNGIVHIDDLRSLLKDQGEASVAMGRTRVDLTNAPLSVGAAAV